MDQLMRAFLMYVLGYSLFFTRVDRIHIALLDCLSDVDRIHEWDREVPAWIFYIDSWEIYYGQSHHRLDDFG